MDLNPNTKEGDPNYSTGMVATFYVDKNGEIHSSVPETNEENPLKQALFNIFGEIIIER